MAPHMMLHSLRISRVSQGLSKEVGRPAARVRQRDGLLLRLVDRAGRVGLGEASPLPGYSPDSIDDTFSALSRLTTVSIEECMCAGSHWWRRLQCLARLLPRELPAARFALETAVLDLACQQAQCSPFELLDATHERVLSVNALLHDPQAFSLQAVKARLSELKATTLKVKLGNPTGAALDMLHALGTLAGVKLRCDANRCLDRQALAELLPELERLGVEFLEEPCTPDLWSSMPESRPAIALDETLMGSDPSELPSLVWRSKASVLVLKPMALGGFCRCREFAVEGVKLGMSIVVTHLFDGPIALQAASALALMVQTPSLAAGLAPHTGLEAWREIIPDQSAACPSADSFEYRLISLPVQLPESQ